MTVMTQEHTEGDPPLHEPVLVRDVLHYIAPESGDSILDCTFGSGGHARHIAREIEPGGTLIAMDWDPDMPSNIPSDLEKRDLTFHFVSDNFARAKEALSECGRNNVDGLLADLGWSMDQLRSGGKGLTFEKDEFLDMRYRPEADRTAADILHEADREELTEWFRTHGEHKFGRKLADRICEEREKRPLRRTLQLMDLIEEVVGEHRKREVAARIFQALRSEVNQELQNLETLLDQLPDLLTSGGRGCVISFHSLEDRRVKNAFQSGQEKGYYRILTDKPVRPDDRETEQNPSSRSARLRAVEKK